MAVEDACSAALRQFEHPRAVIFDMDGVLVETERLKAQAHSVAVRNFGGHAPTSLYEQCMGRSHEEVQRAFMHAAGINVAPEIYAAEFRRIYSKLLQGGLEAAPGSVSLLSHLAERRFQLGVVTSSSKSIAYGVLSQTSLLHFFAAVVTADDVAVPKPAPDCYRLALEKLQLQADQAVAVEDSEAGVMAAAGADLPVIAVRHPLNTQHRFDAAHAVLDSLNDTVKVAEVIERLLRHGSHSTGRRGNLNSHADDCSHH